MIINQNCHFDNIFHIEYSNATINNVNLDEGYFLSFIKSINTNMNLSNCSFQNLFLIDNLYAFIWIANSNIIAGNISFIENQFSNTIALLFTGINQTISINSITLSKNINISIIFSNCSSSTFLFQDQMIFTYNNMSMIIILNIIII